MNRDENLDQEDFRKATLKTSTSSFNTQYVRHLLIGTPRIVYGSRSKHSNLALRSKSRDYSNLQILTPTSPCSPETTTMPPIKITFLAYKKPTVSIEEFIRRWKAHGYETALILQKHGALEYTQQHSSPESIESLKNIITENAHRALEGEDGGPVADGVATMVFPDWESAEAFFKDEENKEQAKREAPGVTDYWRRKMVVGEEIVFHRTAGQIGAAREE